MIRRKKAKLRIHRPTPAKCFFCVQKKEPSFLETEFLEKFTSDRGKIIGRSRSGICQKHQRRLAKDVKKARHLALLPFLSK